MNQITIAPAIVNVSGKTKVERQVSVVRTASPEALTACLSLKGKVGNAIRVNAAYSGYIDVVTACINSNYKPLVEMLSIRLGEPMIVSNRASFESLPDLFEARIMKAKLAKNDGMRTDKKTGAQVSGAKLAVELELKALVIDVISRVNDHHAKRKAEQQAEQQTIEA
jgi:hypothetical protein